MKKVMPARFYEYRGVFRMWSTHLNFSKPAEAICRQQDFRRVLGYEEVLAQLPGWQQDALREVTTMAHKAILSFNPN